MKKITVTDSESQSGAIGYLAKSLKPLCGDFCGEQRVGQAGGREILKLAFPDKYLDLFKSETEDKVADIIAVKYKYDFFKKRLKVEGLGAYDKELLFSAIISADLTEDKRYIIRKIRSLDNFVIDGIYNFKLLPLRNKWREILYCIPPYFTKTQLADFVAYLVGEKRGKKVIVDRQKVYDANYNLLERSKLIDGDGDLLKEILLSSGGSLEIASGVTKEQFAYLKSFFGKRISFLKGSSPKTVDKNF